MIVDHTCFCRSRVVGRRPALEVDRAVPHWRDSVRGSDELVLDVELRHLQLVLDRIDDAQAQVDSVADRLLLVVVIGEQIEASRCPMVIEPLSLTFLSVSCAAAVPMSAPATNSAASSLLKHFMNRSPWTVLLGILLDPRVGQAAAAIQSSHNE